METRTRILGKTSTSSYDSTSVWSHESTCGRVRVVAKLGKRCPFVNAVDSPNGCTGEYVPVCLHRHAYIKILIRRTKYMVIQARRRSQEVWALWAPALLCMICSGYIFASLAQAPDDSNMLFLFLGMRREGFHYRKARSKDSLGAVAQPDVPVSLHYIPSQPFLPPKDGVVRGNSTQRWCASVQPHSCSTSDGVASSPILLNSDVYCGED